MKYELRPYQKDSIDAASQKIMSGEKTALIVVPTAGGKTWIAAEIAKRAIEKSPNIRILVLCHQGHLLIQNEETMNKICPNIKTGVFCSGTGRKDFDAQIVYASRDSLGRNPLACGVFDGIIADECHLITTDLDDGDTMYSRIIKAQKYKWLIGMSGSPWRLAGGNVWGKDNFFKSIAYNIPMRQLINEGHLSPYIFPPVETKIDTSDLKKSSTGDFVISQLEKVAGRELCERAVREWMRHAAQRRVSLFFCVSRAHGKIVTEIIADKIGKENVGYLDGETRKSEREAMVQHIKAGKYRAVVNIGTLTTGFDAPIIDCVVFLRPTASASLFVQMSGRGLRRFPGKTNCMFLDMADNFARFGSIETPKVLGTGVPKKKLEEEMPQAREGKPCPQCGYPLSIRPTACPFCGEVFVKLSDKPFSGEIEGKWYELHHVYVDDYLAKSGNFCKRINYRMKNGMLFQEYFTVLKSGWAQRKFEERSIEIRKKPFAVFGAVDGRLIKVEKFQFERTEHDN
jgi:DNA repair protein RadD